MGTTIERASRKVPVLHGDVRVAFCAIPRNSPNWNPRFRNDFSKLLERAKGFEPSTPTLARLCSPPELHPRPKGGAAAGRAYDAMITRMQHHPVRPDTGSSLGQRTRG